MARQKQQPRATGARPSSGSEAAGSLPPTLAARVREQTGGGSWSAARALCAAGRVRVAGELVTDPAFRPAIEQTVEIVDTALARATPSLLVYFDAELAVVRKAPGLLTVPFERGDRDTLLALARVALGRADRRGRPTLRAVQRLDRESSGLVVFARSVEAQRRLQEQFVAHSAVRIYRAIAHGEVAPATYESLLVRDRGDGLRGAWRESRGTPPPDARWALTRVAPRERLGRATLLDCALETGRQHQIRIHLAEAGHPLLGETVYNRDFSGPWLKAPRLLLHAGTLGFAHPRTGRELRFEDEPPEDFAAALTALRRRRRSEEGKGRGA